MKNFSLLAIMLFSILIFSCQDSTDLNPNTAPTALFMYAPAAIDTSTIVIFNAAASSDLEDDRLLLNYKWDFEGKMIWTEPSSDPEAIHIYTKAGTYDVGLKVLDTEGWSGEIRKSIIVVDSL